MILLTLYSLWCHTDIQYKNEAIKLRIFEYFKGVENEFQTFYEIYCFLIKKKDQYTLCLILCSILFNANNQEIH